MVEKTNLRDIPGVITLLVIIGVTLGISVLVFQGFSDNTVDYDTYSIGNETITGSLDTAVSLANDDLVSSSEIVTNATDGVAVPATNYSIAYPAGTLTVLDAVWDTQSINVSYDYTEPHQSSTYDILQEGVAGLDNISEFQSLFGLVLAAMVILGMIFFLEL